MSTEVHQAAETVTTSNELDLLFGPLFDEYFNGENQVVLKSSAVTTTDASNKRQQPDSTSSTSTLATTVTANGNFDLYSIYTIKRETEGLDDVFLPASFQRSRIHKPHAHTHAFKVNRSTSRSLILNFPTIKEPQKHKLIKEVKSRDSSQGDECKITISKNSKSKDKGSRLRSQSMNEQSYYKQDKTKTRQSINVKNHIFNVRGDNDKSKQTPTRMLSAVRRRKRFCSKPKLCQAWPKLQAHTPTRKAWTIELFSDYDCEIRYHPGKANVVADALSRKERVKPKRVRAMNMILQSSIKDRILMDQKEVVDESAGL
ncbi:hypothetical protein Tco_0398313 [Tanacetum coccineum]